MAEDTILGSVKNILGIPSDQDPFDQELILHINSVLFTLRQLGVVSNEGFELETGEETWNHFFAATGYTKADVAAYIGYKVRIAFDPPTNQSLLSSYKEMISELEWRLNSMREEKEWTPPTSVAPPTWYPQETIF